MKSNQMENQQQQYVEPRQGRSVDRQEGGGYKGVARQAVVKEAEVKAAAGPAVSMTVVGERVEFTQHFHF